MFVGAFADFATWAAAQTALDSDAAHDFKVLEKRARISFLKHVSGPSSIFSKTTPLLCIGSIKAILPEICICLT